MLSLKPKTLSYIPAPDALSRDFPQLILVRGAGDLATGVIQKLVRAGFPVVAAEVPAPMAIRRLAALSDAMYQGEARVEDITAVRCASPSELPRVLREGKVPVIADPELKLLPLLAPEIIVDAVLAKRNLGLTPQLAPFTIALGPGFSAGTDCDVVIETMRGHHLGRLIFDGPAMPNTGIPGVIGGHDADRVIHAPAEGRISNLHDIGDRVQKGDLLGRIIGGDGSVTEVLSPLSGVLRGIIRSETHVRKGMKIGDVDPRESAFKHCDTISDKSRNLGGAALEAVCMYLSSKARR